MPIPTDSTSNRVLTGPIRSGFSPGLLAAALVFAAVRIALFPFAREWLGDAVVRIQLAIRWLENPGPILSYAEAYQYGPLHQYLLGAALFLHPDKSISPRLISLIFGILTVIPLGAFFAQLFGRRVAAWSLLLLAFYPLHVQCSTVSGSEAVFYFFFVSSLWFWEVGRAKERREFLMLSGLTLTLACGFRYNGWFYIPLLGLLLVDWQMGWRWLLDRATWQRLLAFGLPALAFPLAWMLTNWLLLGDPLAPHRHVNEEHAVLAAAQDATGWGGNRFRTLWFWPLVLGVTLSPGILFLGLFGFRSLARHTFGRRYLILLLAVPALYILRGLIFSRFYVLPRFTMSFAILLAPVVGFSLEELVPRWGVRRARLAAGAAWVLLIMTFGLLLVLAAAGGVEWAQVLSPLSAPPRRVLEVAAHLQGKIGEGREALVDSYHYDEFQIIFYTDSRFHPFARHVREKSIEDPEFLPVWIVVHEEGSIHQREDFRAGPEWARFRGHGYRIEKRIGSYRIYRREMNGTGASDGGGEGLRGGGRRPIR